MVSSSLQLPVQKRAWDTRERILVAAVSCLAEEGYAATTTSRIQIRAEVSRGSLLHQFPSRDDLLIAAVHHLAQQRTAELDERSEVARSIDEAVDTLWATFQGPLFQAALQLWTAAQHNAELAAALVPQEHELGRRIRASVARLFGTEYVARTGFSELVSLLISSMRGIALTYTFEARDATAEPYLPLWRGLAHQVLD